MQTGFKKIPSAILWCQGHSTLCKVDLDWSQHCAAGTNLNVTLGLFFRTHTQLFKSDGCRR